MQEVENKLELKKQEKEMSKKSFRSPKNRYRAEISLVSKAPKGAIGRRQTTALTANSIDEFRPLIDKCFPVRDGLEAIEVTVFKNKKRVSSV